MGLGIGSYRGDQVFSNSILNFLLIFALGFNTEYFPLPKIKSYTIFNSFMAQVKVDY